VVFDIAQTAPTWCFKKASMSGTWFHQKAEQCAQLAKDATNLVQRPLLEEESRLRLQIAAAEERQENKRKKARGRSLT
jgi:hypothetical protein